MKRIVFVAMAMLALASCKDKGPTCPECNPFGSPEQLTAKIDGVWMTTSAPLVFRSGDIFTVSGTFSPSSAVAVTVLQPLVVGKTYRLDANGEGSAVVITDAGSWHSESAGGFGNLTITGLTSTHVAGTFTFTGMRSSTEPKSKTSEGIFDVLIPMN